jgi:predicted dienelactone hydrolase
MVYPDALSTNYETYGIDPAYQEVASSKDGPFPLVVFSPGQGASSTLYIQIGARLASHGFVVAIPTNYDDRMTMTGQPEFYASQESYTLGIYIERARDLQYLMTRLVADSQQSGNLLSGTVRSDQIAVSGHSVGGGAALALAGGDDLACDIPGVDSAVFSSETCIPILPDPRIKAVVTVDGSNWLLYYAELARIEIPNMGIGREWDTLKSASPGFEHDQARQHAAVQSSPSYRVDVAYANHMSFANACAINQVLHDQGIIDDATLDQILKMACPSEPVSEEEIGFLTSQYMIAFLKTALVGETGYQEMLTTDYALENEPFIEFFETEKGSPTVRGEDAYFTYFMHQPGTLQAKALKDQFLMAP